MANIKVGILRGGPSSEYNVSLKTGEAVLKGLQTLSGKYEPVDVFIDRAGVWHFGGVASEPHAILKNFDVVFNAMHGEYGEDGKVQKFLEAHKMPYTGSDSFASATSMHKRLSREIFEISGIKTAPAVSVRAGENIGAKTAEAIRQSALPLIVKPASRGSSVGVFVAKNIYDAIEAVHKSFEYDDEVLIEKKIAGREATVAVMENYRGEKHYAFPVVEIVPPKYKEFFDYECKYDGSTQEICPGRFNPEVSGKIKNAAVAAHQSLGCRHYSRSDFMVDKNDNVYILETNTLPGLTRESLCPKALAAAGLEFPQLLDHLITLAIRKPA